MWARNELDRRNVQIFRDALAVVEGLTNYRLKKKQNTHSKDKMSP